MQILILRMKLKKMNKMRFRIIEPNYLRKKIKKRLVRLNIVNLYNIFLYKYN